MTRVDLAPGVTGTTDVRGHRAVTARRHEPPDSLDFFPTPPWATRALMTEVLPASEALDELTAWEPCCGEGHMAVALAERFGEVIATDIHDYGFGGVRDFLDPLDPAPAGVDWIITNPPFNAGLAIAERALGIASRGVALLVRLAFLEGLNRHDALFDPHPPAAVAIFVERVPMHRGRWLPDGSTATAYCWIVWRRGHNGFPEIRWIPPGQRRRLTHADDAQRFGAATATPMGF